MIIPNAVKEMMARIKAENKDGDAAMLVGMIEELEAENERLRRRLSMEQAMDEAVKRGEIE